MPKHIGLNQYTNGYDSMMVGFAKHLYEMAAAVLIAEL